MVNLTSYTLYIRHIRYLKSFDLYGKFEKGDWQLIDSQVNAIFNKDPTNTSNYLQNFTCKFTNVYHKFKIQQTGPDNLNENFITISRIYFFGGFYPNLKQCTCQQSLFPRYFSYFMITVIILL